MMWKVIDGSIQESKPYLLTKKGEVPFVGEKKGKRWNLIQLGGWASDADPDYEPTHFQELEPL